MHGSFTEPKMRNAVLPAPDGNWSGRAASASERGADVESTRPVRRAHPFDRLRMILSGVDGSGPEPAEELALVATGNAVS